MAVAVIMPRQGQSVESCIITEWSKKEGDQVAEGDILFSYETDKASFDEEAKVAGTLLKILAHEDDDVPVLENVAIIGEPGEDISEFIKEVESVAEQIAEEIAEEKPAASAATSAQSAPVATASAGSAQAASPRARNLAAEQGLDLAQATPTGPHGRIIERDVRSMIASEGGLPSSAPASSAPAAAAVSEVSEAASDYEDVKLSNVRKVIAKSMHTSLSTMAQLTNTASFDATNILVYRKQLKAGAESMGLANITLNDIVMFAVSRVLGDHKDLNAHYLDDKMRIFSHVNLGMAVDTPRGLLVPTIFGADTLTLNALSMQAKDLAAKAQEGSISPDQLTNASFTVSNLGSFGTESFTPVINPPQVAILGVNTISTRVRAVDGNVVPYQSMALSLTYDHRAVDGAPAARFLQALCRALENFTVLLAK